MGLYDRIENEKRGEASRLNEMAEARANEIAKRKLEDVALRQMEAESQAVREQNIRNVGREEGAAAMEIMQNNGGLGMGSRTAESIGQQDQMRQSSMQDAAMQIISEIETAQSKGASEEQLMQMINSIPPELQGTIKQIQAGKREQMNAGSSQQQPKRGLTGRENTGITDYARNLLQ